ncbi:MAG: hypothetical protein ACE5G9_10050 [Nitrospinales bacterium]
MTRLISATRKIAVTDTDGNRYSIIFKLPSQSRVRAIRKASLGPDGNLDGAGFADKMTRETVELLLEVEGAQAAFDENPEHEMTVCSAMTQEEIQGVKDFYRQNNLEYYPDAPGWKAVFITLFADVFERATLDLWKGNSQNRLNEVGVGK